MGIKVVADPCAECGEIMSPEKITLYDFCTAKAYMGLSPKQLLKNEAALRKVHLPPGLIKTLITPIIEAPPPDGCGGMQIACVAYAP
jgi:hypothetical protein